MKEFAKLSIFAALTKTGSHFDLKNGEYSAINIGPVSLYNYKKVGYLEYGNYNFGVAANAFGLTLVEALVGA
jgi:hypothetical protein